MSEQLWQQLLRPVLNVIKRIDGPDETRDQDAWLKPVWIMSAFVLFVGLMLTVWQHGYKWLNKPIRELQLHGEIRHLDRQKLGQELSTEFQGFLLEVDINALKERLEDEAWVRRAAVKLAWPGRVDIFLQEEVPVARWGDKGLLNQQGDIFWPELVKEYSHLPKLSGPARDTAKVMAQFHDLNQLFRQADLNIKALELEARGAWTLTLDNDIKIVAGRNELTERLARFIKIYRQQLVAQIEYIEQVDIRYTNGLAVRWKAGRKPNNDE